MKLFYFFDVVVEILRMKNLKCRVKEMVRDKVVSDRELFVFVGVDWIFKFEVDLSKLLLWLNIFNFVFDF